MMFIVRGLIFAIITIVVIFSSGIILDSYAQTSHNHFISASETVFSQ